MAGNVHSHRRSLADGTIEHHLPVTCLLQHFQMLVKAAVGRMDRPWDDTRLHPFGLLAEIDKNHAVCIFPDDRFGRDGCDLPLPSQIEPHADIFGHRHIHHFGIWQIQIRHQFDICLTGTGLKARVESLLFANRRHHVSLIVMRRINKCAVRQFEKVAEERIILVTGIAVLEISAAGAPDQQRITGEHAIIHPEAIAVIRVAGGIHRVEAQPLDRDRVAVGDAYRYNVNRRLLTHDGDAVGAVTKRSHGGDMIGMNMRIDHLHQLQVEFLQKLQVAVRLLEHRIDKQCLTSGPARQKIGVCR